MGDELSVLESRPVGTAWLLDGLWSQLGVSAVVTEVLVERRFSTDVERVLFAMVANRAIAPRSKLACAEWASHDVAITALEEMTDDQTCRAMVRLTRQRGHTPFAPEHRHTPPQHWDPAHLCHHQLPNPGSSVLDCRPRSRRMVQMRRPNWLTFLVAAAAVLFTAACTPKPPPPPPPPPPLTITTTALPLLVPDQPYSSQLQATGGSGPVTWTLLSGSLPTGISLDSSGLISGTVATGQPWTPGLLRVQATNGTASATKLLLLINLPGVPTLPAVGGGTPLPEGDRIGGFVSPFPGECGVGCGWTLFEYLADGTPSAVSTISVKQASEIGLLGFGDGSKVVFNPAFFGLPAAAIEVLDGDSGAVLATLDHDPAVPVSAFTFSPDASKVALSDESDQIRVFDTTTGAAITSFPGTPNAWGSVQWSPDSTEIVQSGTGVGNTITIVSVNGSGSRQVTVPPGTCSVVSDWSATNRLLLQCYNGIWTVSAVDGSDFRLIAASQLNSLPGTSFNFTRSVFSPSGTRILLGEVTITAVENPPDGPQIITYGGSRLLVAPDATPLTPLDFTELLSSTQVLVGGHTWT